jgi:hypothetical protein
MNILLLCNRPKKKSEADTVISYLNAFTNYSNNKFFEISLLHHFPSKINLNKFDAVILHYSLPIGKHLDFYYSKELINKLIKYRGLKITFLQDEYSSVHTCCKNLKMLGIDILFTCVPDKEIQKVYPSTTLPKLKIVNILTGCTPESFLKYKKTPICNRAIDVGYRSRKNPYWLGKLGYEKFFIAQQFKLMSHKYNLNLDLSTNENDRIYGQDWIDFVGSCKTMIGVESGSSIFDFSGELENKVNNIIKKDPNISFERVYNQCLKPFEGNVYLNQISPRCFEAAALKTPMVLFEGKYSGILKPNKHFIPLKKDFSNFDDVVKKIRNYSYLQKMADRVYNDIALNPKYSYKSFIKKIDKVIDLEFSKRNKKIVLDPYNETNFNSAIRLSWKYFIRISIRNIYENLFLRVPLLKYLLFRRYWSTVREKFNGLFRSFFWMHKK